MNKLPIQYTCTGAIMYTVILHSAHLNAYLEL